MITLLRPLFERWLLEATQAPLAPWKRSLLRSALQRDPALRRLALELADFAHESAPEAKGLHDLRPRLKAILASDQASLEQPLLPSGWLPAGALAAMLLVALLVSVFDGNVSAPRGNEQARAEDSQAARDLSLPSPTPTATPYIKPEPGHIEPGPAPTSRP